MVYKGFCADLPQWNSTDAGPGGTQKMAFPLSAQSSGTGPHSGTGNGWEHTPGRLPRPALLYWQVVTVYWLRLPPKTTGLSKKWRRFYRTSIRCLANAYAFTELTLKGVDAVIATGSNNSARYFEYYFRNIPHIIRKNRNGIAVLSGEESEEELYRLGEDIFTYFGMGCRNVTKLFIPDSYDLKILLGVLDRFSHLVSAS